MFPKKSNMTTNFLNCISMKDGIYNIEYVKACVHLGNTICVASLQKDPDVAKRKNEIFVDHNRAGHDKTVKKISF